MENNLIKEVSQGISNFNFSSNIQATKELMELFQEISKTQLTSADDYINMYDDNFYAYETFEELVLSEEEQNEGLTREQCINEINKSIWKLPCGWCVQYV